MKDDELKKQEVVNAESENMYLQLIIPQIFYKQ